MAVEADAQQPAVEHPAVDTEGRRLLTELVSIPSVSGNETEAAEALAAFFEERGRETWIDEIEIGRASCRERV